MTQKPLLMLLPDILRYIEDNRDRVEYANRLKLVDAGQLLPEIETSLRKEFTPKTVDKMIERIPCINLLTRIVDKLSRIYDEPITRSSDRKSYKKFIEFLEKSTNLNDKMGWANRAYNLYESCAIEPYMDSKGEPKVRVLTPDQFLVWSDDERDPTNPTVFIKFMGDAERIQREGHVDNSGIYKKPSENARVNVYHIYSATEFIIVDGDGIIRDEMMPETNQAGINPLGELPIVYVNKSPDKLIPLPNTDMLNNTILIPKLLGDLNYAIKYLSHSVIVSRDLDLPEELERNPDSVWVLSSSATAEENGTTGSIEVITPKVDIDAVLRLIQSLIATWLESLGVRPGSMGQPTGSSRTSALAKIVDEADTTAARTSQVNMFTQVENKLFKLMNKFHSTLWVGEPGYMAPTTPYDDDEITPIFPEQKILTSEKDRIEKAMVLHKAGLATAKQAIRLIWPTMTEDELDAWVQELDNDTITEITVGSQKDSQQTDSFQAGIEQDREGSGSDNQD